MRVGRLLWRCTSAKSDSATRLDFNGTGENVRRNDGVLDGIVDPDAAYGGHRVRGISDEQDPRLVPARAAAGLNGEERKLLPVHQGFGVPD